MVNNELIVILILSNIFIGYMIGSLMTLFLSGISNFYFMTSFISFLFGCLYWYRLIVYKYYNKILFFINLFKSLSSIDIRDKMSKESNNDNNFMLDTRFKVATIKYKKYGKDYNLFIPYDSNSKLTRLRGRKVYVKINKFSDIMDLDNTSDIGEDNNEKYIKRDIEEDFIDITQQPGIPYLVTPNDFKSSEDETVSILIKNRVGDILDEIVENDQVLMKLNYS